MRKPMGKTRACRTIRKEKETNIQVLKKLKRSKHESLQIEIFRRWICSHICNKNWRPA